MEVLLYDKALGTFLIKANVEELANMCGFSSKHIEEFKPISEGKKTMLQIGKIYRDAAVIVNTISNIMDALRVISGNAKRLERHLEELEESSNPIVVRNMEKD